MKIDLILESSAPAGEIATLGALADGYGLGTIWVSCRPNSRDPFVNMGELARLTSQIRMGPIALSPYDTHPMKMAQSLLTLNELSHGRASIVIGTGGSAMGMIGGQTDRPVRAVRECIEIIRLAASRQAVQYVGQMYTVRGLHAAWATSAPPLLYAGANHPQMQRMAARYADGVMLSDRTIPQVAAAHAILDQRRAAYGRSGEPFRLNNFWAWHVKPNLDDAIKEARRWLSVRGTAHRGHVRSFLNEDDTDLVMRARPAFMAATRDRTHVIEGVPEHILETMVEQLTTTASVDRLDTAIDQLKRFQRAGLNEIALRLYDDPEDSIRLIGERVASAVA